MRIFVQQRPYEKIQLNIYGTVMKKIISLVVLLSASITAQTLAPKSLAELKQISQSSIQHPVSGIQNLVPSIQSACGGQAPSIQSAIGGSVSSIQYLASNFQPPASDKKNPAIAILYSFLLPGMGELYAGDYSSGKYYTFADGLLWGTFAGFEIYANNQMNNYKAFAKTNAGALTDGKDADYFATIGIYPNIDEYNTAMLLNRNFDKTYNPVTHSWNWINPDQRKEYRDMWTSSESAFTNVRFVIGALILNRIISVVNAVRLVSAHNKNINSQASWNIYLNVEMKETASKSLTLNFVSNF